MNRKDIFEHVEPNECPYCKVYSLVFVKNRHGVIENMKCQKCLRKFNINWTNSKPRPVYLDYSVMVNLHLKNIYL